jgi:threonyl-tRNA synthetase
MQKKTFLKDKKIETKYYSFSKNIGSGLVLWQPEGAIIRMELQKLILQELNLLKYQQVITPHISDISLYKKSGHIDHYENSQYPPIVGRMVSKNEFKKSSYAEILKLIKLGKVKGYILKPMNCPMHVEIFNSTVRSYKDLPIRIAEFGTVYRWEKSGELNKMTRTRGFTQDDAHIFCMENQVEEEIYQCLKLVKKIFHVIKIDFYKIRLGTRSTVKNTKNYYGSNEIWIKSENILRNILKKLNIDFYEESGNAAFYGPKIDFIAKDSFKREWQLGTIQLDYNLSIALKANYVGPKNKTYNPIIIHRAPLGSIERLCSILIEHFRGKFPLWLSPEQVRILLLNNDRKIENFGEKVLKKLTIKNIRVKLDKKPKSLSSKILKSEKDYIPYTIIIGNKERKKKCITIRSRNKKSIFSNRTICLKKFISYILEKINNRK